MQLSIVIPSFQQGNHLIQALASISEQKFMDYEILILDACSTDDTVLNVKAFSNLPITLIQSPDKGVYDAMNKGVKLAKGNWLYFMGCDDKLYNSEVLSSFDRHFDDVNIDIFYGDVILSSNSSRYAGQFDINMLLGLKNICHQAIFYRKTVFDKIGPYNLKYKIWADWDFNIRCFKNTELIIQYVDTIVAFYNNESGISSTFDEEFSKELPLFFLNKINSLENQMQGIIDSKSFQIGSGIVGFMNKVKRFLLFK